MSAIPRVLTVAGSDSGGGAGVQQDLKTFASLGAWGLSAVTSITAQDSEAVRERYDLPPAVVVAQIRAVAADIGLDAAKTGMLGTREILLAVAVTLAELAVPNLVVDPVLVSTSGSRLLDADAMDALLGELLPLAAVVTPNALEAEALTGIKVASVAGQREAARALVARGAQAAVVTGGHVAGDKAVDVVVTGSRTEEIAGERLEGDAHGTGCMFSAALAVGLARGLDVVEAVRGAKHVVQLGIEGSVRLGRGPGAIRI